MRRLDPGRAGSAAVSALPLQAADALSEARRLYNAGQYEAAERAAREALTVPATADAARVVLGRIADRAVPQVGRREGSRGRARVADGAPTRARCSTGERLELSIGQAEVLYLDGTLRRLRRAARAGARPIGRARPGGARARARLVGHRPRPACADDAGRHERRPIYTRILERMHGELQLDGGSAPGELLAWRPARGVGRSRTRLAGGDRRLGAGGPGCRIAARRCAPISIGW